MILAVVQTSRYYQSDQINETDIMVNAKPTTLELREDLPEILQ